MKRKTKIPKYVSQHFTPKLNKKKITKRYNQLEKSKWGYKTKEYKHLKKYLKK